MKLLSWESKSPYASYIHERLLLRWFAENSASPLLLSIDESIFYYTDSKELYHIIRHLASQENRNVASEALLILRQKYNYDYVYISDLFFGEEMALPFLQIVDEPVWLLKKLKRLLYRRVLLQETTSLLNSVADTTIEEIELIVAKNLTEIEKLQSSISNDTFYSIEQYADSLIEDIYTGKNLLRTGQSFVDDRIGGLTRRHISSLRARSSQFKSTYCDNLLLSTASLGNKVLLCSLEDPIEERIKRMYSSLSGIPLSDIRQGKIRLQKEHILETLDSIFQKRVYLHDKRTIVTANDVVTLITDIKPDLVIIDHLQQFKTADRVLGLGEAIQDLELAANRNNCNIFITSQVSDKGFQHRTEKHPSSGDDNWTSDLFQTSSEAFSLYYKYRDTHNPIHKEQLTLRIIKARYSGNLGKINLSILSDYAKINGETSNPKLYDTE